MSIGRGAFLASIGAGTAAACAALVLVGGWLVLPVPLLLTGAWVAAWRGGRPRLSSACFASGVCLCAAGMFAGLSPLLMLAACSSFLGAWDSGALCRKTSGASDRSAARRLEAAHVGRLLLICAASVAVGAAALLFRLRPGFGVLFLFGTALTLGLGILVRRLGRD